MENAVYHFLVDIVNSIHPPIRIGINRYTFEIRHNTGSISNEAFVYYGNKNNLYCEQIEQELLIRNPFTRDLFHVYRISLADPSSRETIANIFRTN